MNKETSNKIIDFFDSIGFTVREIGQRAVHDNWHGNGHIMVFAEDKAAADLAEQNRQLQLKCDKKSLDRTKIRLAKCEDCNKAVCNNCQSTSSRAYFN